ncbi:MAG: hypothetical protein U1F43_05190 [Myxococcota bacterium]
MAAVARVDPPLADPDGGGRRVVIRVDDASGALGATLGGVALDAFAIDDATHVSGIPGPHAAGVVDVAVTTAAGPSTGGEGRFEYWSPRQIEHLDSYLDAGKGMSRDDTALAGRLDQGPERASSRRPIRRSSPRACPASSACCRPCASRPASTSSSRSRPSSRAAAPSSPSPPGPRPPTSCLRPATSPTCRSRWSATAPTPTARSARPAARWPRTTTSAGRSS